MDDRFYSENPFGSQRWGSTDDAVPLSRGGAPVAMLEGMPLRRREEEPTIFIGAGGTGKFANLGPIQIVHDSVDSFFLLDAGGQFMSTTWHWNLAEGRDVYAINPEGISAYPDICHGFNMFEGILARDKFLFDRSKAIANMTITKEPGENGWVAEGAERFYSRFLMRRALLQGDTTPVEPYQDINAFTASDEAAKALTLEAEHLPYDIAATLLELYQLKKGAQRTFGSYIGKIGTDLDYLSSPQMSKAISSRDNESPLAKLPIAGKKTGVYLPFITANAKANQSFLRTVTGIAMLHCQLANQGARPLFYLEEAAACGNADFIKQAVSQNRKFQQTVLVYQSFGQIEHHFGKAGATEIVDGCGMQVFLGGGMRSIESAKRGSETLGEGTIEAADPVRQADRRHHAREAMRNALWNGADIMNSAHQYHHEVQQSERGYLKGRALLSPAELLNLNRKFAVVLVPGLGLPPFLATKLPNYWQNPMMAGRYGPDPLFPPIDRVSIKRGLFSKSRRFIRCDAPAHLRDRPAHINGQVAYVEGFRTF